jgi:magnesium chelatase subunit D
LPPQAPKSQAPQPPPERDHATPSASDGGAAESQRAPDGRQPPPPLLSHLQAEGQGGPESSGDDGPEWYFAPLGDGGLPQIALQARPRSDQQGTRRAGSDAGDRGPRIGAREATTLSDGSLALDATIRAAAKFQPQRSCAQAGALHLATPPKPRLLIRRQDWRLKLRRTPAQHLYILVVDSSGSMAAYQRMAQVKGVLLGLLRDVYRHRDGVAVIAFRGSQSDMLLAPTRSPEAAQAFIEALPTGGRTPLAHALLRVEGLLTNERRRQTAWVPVLILVTDGRPNRGLTHTDPMQESLSICRRLAATGLQAVVVDTEVGVIRLGLASRLATALSAPYVRLEFLLRGQR